jgi:hypothetical protein
MHVQAVQQAGYNPVRANIVGSLWDAGVRSLGTVDVGLPAYILPDLVVLDLGGLTDADIARAPGPHVDKDIPVAYLDAHAPDAFLITSRLAPKLGDGGNGVMAAGHYPTEQRVMASDWFRDHYRYRTGVEIRYDFYLLWFERM